jgi:hypothetical protein
MTFSSCDVVGMEVDDETAPSSSGRIRQDTVSLRWGLVDGFLQSINCHREVHVTPSDLICVGESISRWYGLGGHWIYVGLPHYVEIDRKPENRCGYKIARAAVVVLC